jgi:hypothetical protein
MDVSTIDQGSPHAYFYKLVSFFLLVNPTIATHVIPDSETLTAHDIHKQVKDAFQNPIPRDLKEGDRYIVLNIEEYTPIPGLGGVSPGHALLYLPDLNSTIGFYPQGYRDSFTIVQSAITGTQGIMVSPDPIGNKQFRKTDNPVISALSMPETFTKVQIENLNKLMGGTRQTSTAVKGVTYKEYRTEGISYTPIPTQGLLSYLSSPQENCLTFIKARLKLKTIPSPFTQDYNTLYYMLTSVYPLGAITYSIPNLQPSQKFLPQTASFGIGDTEQLLLKRGGSKRKKSKIRNR